MSWPLGTVPWIQSHLPLGADGTRTHLPSPLGALASRWSYLIVIVVVEAIAGRGIDAAGLMKQEARTADTAGFAKGPTDGLGSLAGCWTGAGLVVGIWRTSCYGENSLCQSFTLLLFSRRCPVSSLPTLEFSKTEVPMIQP